jgi:hypothetical protein
LGFRVKALVLAAHPGHQIPLLRDESAQLPVGGPIRPPSDAQIVQQYRVAA